MTAADYQEVAFAKSTLAAYRSQQPKEPSSRPTADEFERLPADVLEVCKSRDWSLHWTARGAYLHLEASELIEAIRGKHGDPRSEAADVLIVLMSITEHAGIPWRDVLNQAKATIEKLRTKPVYAGEERSTPAYPKGK